MNGPPILIESTFNILGHTPTSEHLHALQSIWNTLEYVAMGLVFFGVLGEFIVDELEILKTQACKSRLKKFSMFLLLIGLVLEMVSTQRSSKYSDETIALINASNVDLQKVLQPRRVGPFTPANRPDLGEAMKALSRFQGIHVILQSVPFYESEMLKNDLESLLFSKGWNQKSVNDWRQTGKKPVLIHDGVYIYTWKPKHVPPLESESPKDKAWLAAEALVKVLQLEGLQLVGHTSVTSMKAEPNAPFGFNPPEDAVVIFIGMKNVDLELQTLRNQREKVAPQLAGESSFEFTPTRDR